MQKDTQRLEVIKKLHRVLMILSQTCQFPFVSSGDFVLTSNHKELLKVTNDAIISPVTDVIKRTFDEPSALVDEDEFLSEDTISNILEDLKAKGNIVRLNHIGFCYRVASVNKSRVEIAKSASQKHLFTYQMDSNDPAQWLFVGDTTNWRDPLLEFVLIEGEIKDKEIDYWLPHIQIDIDTNMFYEPIRDTLDTVLKGTRSINLQTYAGHVSQIRVWLGVIAGINIHLDIGTNARNTRYARRVMLTRI